MHTRSLAAVVLAALTLATAACAEPDPRTQLELQIGLTRAEAGKYGDGQLALMKHILDRPNLSDTRKRYLDDEVRAGRKPRFFLIEF